jgi:hypothetical protein
MTWDGDWRPTLPFTFKERLRWTMLGIVPIRIGGRETTCAVWTAGRGRLVARTIDGKQWFQLLK